MAHAVNFYDRKLKPTINFRRRRKKDEHKHTHTHFVSHTVTDTLFGRRELFRTLDRVPCVSHDGRRVSHDGRRVHCKVSNQTSAPALLLLLLLFFDIYLFTCEIFRRKLGSYAKLSYRFSVTGSVEMLTFRECGGCAVIICSWSIFDDILQYYRRR